MADSTGEAKKKSQLDVAFQRIALEKLSCLPAAATDGKMPRIPQEIWLNVIEEVTQGIAETYFGTSEHLPKD